VRPKRTTIAAGATLLGLGGLAAAAMSAGGETTQPVAATGPVEIRTEVIHQTVHRTRRERPPRAGSGAGPAPRGETQAGAIPVSVVSAPPRGGSGPADAPAPRVATRQSGSEHGDDAREHGDDTSERGDDTESEHGDRRGGSHSNRGRGRDD